MITFLIILIFVSLFIAIGLHFAIKIQNRNKRLYREYWLTGKSFTYPSAHPTYNKLTLQNPDYVVVRRSPPDKE